METLRRPSRPALLFLFSIGVFLPLNAAARPAPALLPGVPLPGYALPQAVELRQPARLDASFPPKEHIFADFADPLDDLASGDEDLHDALNSMSPAEALKIALRDHSVAVKLAAVRVAAYPRNVAAIAPLAGVMLRLDQPADLRAQAALALGRIGDRVAVPSLAEALRDPEPEVRYAAALTLGRLPADGVATRLEKTLRSDPAWLPRYAAAIALARTRKSFVVGSLADALASDPAWQVRQQAARSLADLGTPAAAQALAAALNDSEPAVRAAAGSGLAEIGGPDQRLAVAQALREESEPSVRAVLIAAERRSGPRS